MADHARFVALAKRLIAKHGRIVDFKVIQSDPADTSKPWQGSSTSPTLLLSTPVAFVPHKGLEFGTDIIDDELLKSCSEVGLVAGEIANIESAHYITDTGVDYKINWIRRLKPADKVLVYAIGVER